MLYVAFCPSKIVASHFHFYYWSPSAKPTVKVLARTLLSRLSAAMIKLGKLECTSLDVLYRRQRRSCIWWNPLSLFLSASWKNVREKNAARSHACLEDLRQKGSSNLDPSEVKESKILPRSLAVRQCRVYWYACIICTHLLDPGESSVRRALIIGSGWPNCFALDSSFLVLDNLSRILAKILYNWRWRSIIWAYMWLMTPKCILKCQFQVLLKSHQKIQSQNLTITCTHAIYIYIS